MDRIYLDNAATTALDPEVLEAMMPYLTGKFGNPSSIYSYGREAKMAVESARKSVAKILHCTPGEIFFTSGGTESTNTVLCGSVKKLRIRHIITSPIEHHATLHTVEQLEKEGCIRLSYVRLLPNGHIDLGHLEELLTAAAEKTLVSLMHANNEVGHLLKIKAVAALCEKYGALFHSDMVQTVAHYPIDLSKIKVHFASAAGHKFHGPKGTGILYINGEVQILPLIQGGAQERNMRAGTENVAGIVGFAKALELATERYEAYRAHISGLRQYMYEQLLETFPGVVCNSELEHGLYTVLNVSFPKTDKTEMLLFSLDMSGICVSGGSACSSGANHISHVIKALHGEQAEEMVPIRFSFSHHNTKAEVDQVMSRLKELVPKEVVSC